MTTPLHFPARSDLLRLVHGSVAGVLLALASALAQPTVSNVRATPRTGNKFVDITYDLSHATGLSSTVRVEVSQDGGTNYGTAASLTGAVGSGITPGTGKTVAWNAGLDWMAALFSNVRVRVTADDGQITGGGTAPTGMALIPAGAFVMGDTFNEGSGEARPTRTVAVSAFYMAKTEVTRAEWREVRDWAVSRGYTDIANEGEGKADTHPVQTVSWYDVVKWLNAKSEKEGLTPVYYTNDAQTTLYRTGSIDVTATQVKWTANGYRLATEAEWEKAARGGAAGRRFPWGDTITHQQANYQSTTNYSYDTSTTRGNHPSYATGSFPYTSPVGSFAANDYGLLDMAGNVWEWCWDWYGTYSGSTDPRGVSSGSLRVFRGGSWIHFALNCRVSARAWNRPDLRNGDTGFRAARSTSGSSPVTAVSAAFALDMTAAPTITTQPGDQIVGTGMNVIFRVGVSGTAPFTYQWRKDGANIAGATNVSYVIPAAQLSDAGGYSVVLSSGAGSITSSSATLSVVANLATTYFGDFVGSRGSWSMIVNSSGQGTYVAYLDALKAGIVTNVQVASDGRFSSITTAIQSGTFSLNGRSIAAASVPITVTGTVGSSGVTGSVVGANLTFSGTPDAAGGATAAVSGLYQATGAGSAGTTYTVVGGSGRVLALTVGATFVDGGLGTVGSNGIFSVNTVNNTAITGTVTPGAGTIATTVTPTVGPPVVFSGAVVQTNGPPPRLVNLSILTELSTAGDSFTLGYVVGGAGTNGGKPLVIRAAGPSLRAFGVPGTLDDPKLELFAGTTKTGDNDNWGGLPQLSAAFAGVGAFPYIAPNSKDAAILANITGRDNSVKVSAVGNGTGTVIAELYDDTAPGLITQTTPRLINVSVFKQVGPGYTMGFVIVGNTPRTLLVRAVGPGLANVGVRTGILEDPMLTLFSGSSKINENDNWGGLAIALAAMRQVGAFEIPSSSKDAALVATLLPGSYSARVTGVANASGLVLVEVYEVP